MLLITELRNFPIFVIKLFLFFHSRAPPKRLGASGGRENKIRGVKLADYLDLCKAAELMKNKAHLNEKGLGEIRKIKSGMNKGRIWVNIGKYR